MKRNFLCIVCGLVVAVSTGIAAEPTRLYLANDDHTDYLWTADAETYNAVFVDMLDYFRTDHSVKGSRLEFVD
jgi:alpha-mannosidase